MAPEKKKLFQLVNMLHMKPITSAVSREEILELTHRN